MRVFDSPLRKFTLDVSNFVIGLRNGIVAKN